MQGRVGDGDEKVKLAFACFGAQSVARLSCTCFVLLTLTPIPFFNIELQVKKKKKEAQSNPMTCPQHLVGHSRDLSVWTGGSSLKFPPNSQSLTGN